MSVWAKLNKLIRSVGGYALISNLLALALLLLVAAQQISPYVAASLWIVSAVFEFITRGYLRTVRNFGLKTVLTAKRDWHMLSVGHASRVLASAAGFVLLYLEEVPAVYQALGCAVVALVLIEPVTAAMMRKGNANFHNLPWRSNLPAPWYLRFYAYVANVLMIAFALLSATHVAFTGVTLGLVLVSAITQLGMIARSVLRMRGKKQLELTLHDDLTQFAPEFYFYWDAPAGTAFQAAMWLPYLERLGKKFCIIVRNTANFHDLKAATTAPIIVRPAMADLDALVVPSLKVAFYVNNAIRNAHFARFLGITHIQLNHGDSDKPPSFNPVMRMYDRNFVAGQAAIDRYSNRGIETAESFFEIVGRPQIESITGTRTESDSPETILYAPTWAGFMADSALSSLPLGPAMIAALLERGKRVIFRPHPHSRKNAQLAAACDTIIEMLERDNADNGRGHLYGPVAESEMSIVDCFNESDAMIADVSSVVPDYLYSTKPFCVVAMGFDTVDEFLVENPVAKASYILERDGGNLDAVLDGLLLNDTLAELRAAMKTDYLGDFDPENYSQRFIDVALKYFV